MHLNPVRAKLLRPEEPLRAYRWSSFPAYLERTGRRPAWLRVERVLGEMGIPKDSAAGRRQFERLMEQRRHQDEPATYARIRRGWCLGEEAFRKELLAQVEERLVREGLQKLGWTEPELATRQKGDGTEATVPGRGKARWAVFTRRSLSFLTCLRS